MSKDYRVLVNGCEVPVYTCRISEYPFNRNYPGHQRPLNQSEVVSFVNLVSDETLEIEVQVRYPYKKVRVKPYSKQVACAAQGEWVTFTLRENGSYVLEADSYHHCLYLFNSKPIPAPDPKEVTYYFGPGVHMPGKITLRDNESLYMDKDALVFGGVYANKAENIRVFGNGLLDGGYEARISPNCYEDYTNGNIKLYDCKNVQVEGILMRNSAIWCVNLFHCFDVKLHNIHVFGQWRYNTDGVDIVNSQDIVISDSFIHSFDDTITIKGICRYAKTDCKRIRVENCVLWCDWGKTCEIGIETVCREYADIVFRGCDVLRGGNAAMDIQNGDCAEVHDILFEDIWVEYNAFDTPEQYQDTDEQIYSRQNEIATPHLLFLSNRRFQTMDFIKNMGYTEEEVLPDLGDVHSGDIHDITMRHITVYYDEEIPMTDGKYTVPIRMRSCMPDVRFSSITIEDVTVNGTPLTRESMCLDIDDIPNLQIR